MKLNKGYDNYQDYDDGLYDGDNGDDNKDHPYDNDLYGDWDVTVTILSIGDHGFDQTLNSGMNDESDRNMIVENLFSSIWDHPNVIVYQGKDVVDDPIYDEYQEDGEEKLNLVIMSVTESSTHFQIKATIIQSISM